MSNSGNKMKFLFRLLIGKYSANDYIRLGRYISGGGTDRFAKKKFEKIGLTYHWKFRISRRLEKI